VLEERLVDGDALPAVGDELEEQRLRHHRRRRAVLVEAKVGAGRVGAAVAVED